MPEIDMTRALATVDTIEDLLAELDGQSTEDDDPNLPSRERAAYRAARSAKLLRAAHEAKRLEVLIMDEYHATRSQNRT